MGNDYLTVKLSIKYFSLLYLTLILEQYTNNIYFGNLACDVISY